MKIKRSSICTLKFSTLSKRMRLKRVLREYGRVVNVFINEFWPDPPKKSELLKPIVDIPDTWLTARLRKVAAREAIDMVKARTERDDNPVTKPKHRGRQMHLSASIAELQEPKEAKEFDAWLHLSCIGDRTIMDLPIRFHKHYNELAERGERCNHYIVKENCAQFVFEIETGPKKKRGAVRGLDTGINKLAALDDGQVFGEDMWDHIERVNRREHGSNRQKSARRALKQHMDECARDLFESNPDMSLLVVEKLQKLNHKTRERRRLSKNMRRSIGSWAWRYWLDRLQMLSEEHRVRFRSTYPSYTSQECPECGHVDRSNRRGEMFRCQRCDHSGDADCIAAGNISHRFLSGPYGARFKPQSDGTYVYS